MLKSRTPIAIVLAGLALIATLSTARPARADVLRIATLMPAQSPWGKVFKAWAKAVKQESHGRLELQFFFGNQQGDELEIIAKMRTGQLDGAALTAAGLGYIDHPVAAFELPGLFADWSKLDHARDVLLPEIAAGMRAEGFELIGLYDIGVTRLFTTGAPVASPVDLRTVQPALVRGDVVVATLLAAIDGIDPIELTVPEILRDLWSGSVDAIFAPPLLAEQLQWSSMVKVMVSSPIAFSIGGVVFSRRKVQGLPTDLRLLLLHSGENVTTQLRAPIRGIDDLSLARAKALLTVIDLTTAQKDEWAQAYAKQRAMVRGVKFDAAFFDRLLALAQ